MLGREAHITTGYENQWGLCLPGQGQLLETQALSERDNTQNLALIGLQWGDGGSEGAKVTQGEAEL